MIDPDDTDHRTFIDVGALGRLSHAAFRLHSYAVLNSVRYGHPGFVCDDYLNAITAETTITAMELVAAGVWERRVGGYRVVAAEPVGGRSSRAVQGDSPVHLCEDRGSHAPSGSTP